MVYCVMDMDCRKEKFRWKGYVKAEIFAEQWNVSVRQVEALCQSGRMDGAVKFGNTWAIPIEAKKHTRTSDRKPGRVPRE